MFSMTKETVYTIFVFLILKLSESLSDGKKVKWQCIKGRCIASLPSKALIILQHTLFWSNISHINACAKLKLVYCVFPVVLLENIKSPVRQERSMNVRSCLLTDKELIKYAKLLPTNNNFLSWKLNNRFLTLHVIFISMVRLSTKKSFLTVII